MHNALPNPWIFQCTVQERLLAAHLVRRAGFGPTFKDLKKLSKSPEARLKWINDQLNPASVYDGAPKTAKD